jgi:hypothetical protein
MTSELLTNPPPSKCHRISCIPMPDLKQSFLVRSHAHHVLSSLGAQGASVGYLDCSIVIIADLGAVSATRH